MFSYDTQKPMAFADNDAKLGETSLKAPYLNLNLRFVISGYDMQELMAFMSMTANVAN